MRLISLSVILLLALSAASCRSRAPYGSSAYPAVSTNSTCTAPETGSCAACNISCPVGQSAMCARGQPDGAQCKVQASCKCQ